MPATSLSREVGRPVARLPLLWRLLEVLEVRYEALGAGHSPHAEWAERLGTIGREVQVSSGDALLSGVAEAVDVDGALLLRTDDGGLLRIRAGDVTLRGQRGSAELDISPV
jgi:BirA family biotin operon repressor/biotin-[acetyl-CoA-carboxylase] ligase